MKIAGRCNLKCDYCYVFEKEDQSWRTRPVLMSEDVTTATMERIRQHVEQSDICRSEPVTITLHGGEPLLAGKSYFRRFVEIVRNVLHEFEVALFVQTNGVLLDESWADLLCELDIRIAISLDGDQKANDRHRVDRHGRSSFDKTSAAIELLQQPRYDNYSPSLLAVVDIENDPRDLYEFFDRLGIRSLGILLPDNTWDDPPPGTMAEYGRWLCTFFDAWFDAPADRCVNVRMFDGLVSTILGSDSSSEFGFGQQGWIVIDTDGTILENDYMNVAFAGAGRTRHSVFDSPISAVLERAGMRAVQYPRLALSSACRQCPIVEVCGGGEYAHRYSSENGFVNPSVYCEALYALVVHANVRVHASMLQVQSGEDRNDS